jgi:type IV secretory pathway VirB10-like protein
MDQTPPVVKDYRPRLSALVPRKVKIVGLLAAGFLLVVLITIWGGPPPSEPTEIATAGMLPDTTASIRQLAQRLTQTQADVDGRQAGVTVTMPPPALRAQDLIPGEGEGRRVAARDTRSDEQTARDESLFASNLVLSKREGVQRPTARPAPVVSGDGPAIPEMPSLEDVTNSVVRAMKGAGAPQEAKASTVTEEGQPPPKPLATPVAAPANGEHRVYEGTSIDGVLANRLTGSMTGPVKVIITTPVYAHDLTLVVPAGAWVLGTAKQVQSLGESRLAVGFHRIVYPSSRQHPQGREVSLDQFVGMNQAGDVGLADQTNRHYLSTFGAAAAVGLIQGFSQWVGSGFGSARTTSVIIGGGVADSTGQAMAQTMSHFLNRLPDITIREGHRTVVYLTSDLNLPAYEVTP